MSARYDLAAAAAAPNSGQPLRTSGGGQAAQRGGGGSGGMMGYSGTPRMLMQSSHPADAFARSLKAGFASRQAHETPPVCSAFTRCCSVGEMSAAFCAAA